MMSSSESTSFFNSKLPPHWRCCARSTQAPWKQAALTILARLRDLAPYAALELVLPGGSLMALLLWLYRRRKGGPGPGRPRVSPGITYPA
jgi:hypothetical protein